MKTIGIYPGRFQPAHKGHYGVYKELRQISGPDTFIATSDKTPTPDSPLNFGEKQQIWVRHGVPSSNIVKVKNTYSPTEITQNFMPESTVAVFALGSKDVARFGAKTSKDPKTGKPIWLKADGTTPSYFQPYKGNEDDMQPMEKHSYVLVIKDIKVDGKPISGTNIREALSNPKYTSEQKKKFFNWAFGWYDPSLFGMLVDRFSEATKSIVPQVQKMPKMASMVNKSEPTPLSKKSRTISKEILQNVVAEMLDELSTPQGETPGEPTTNPTEPVASTADLVKQKRDLEAKAKQNKQQRDSYKTTVTNYDRIQKKADRDAIDAVNRQISRPTQPIKPIK